MVKIVLQSVSHSSVESMISKCNSSNAPQIMCVVDPLWFSTIQYMWPGWSLRSKLLLRIYIICDMLL